MHSPSSTIIIFVKNPILGHVKTRLAQGIGKEKALEVYKYLMAHTREVALDLDVKRNLFYDTEIIANDNWSPAAFDKHLQSSGDLGNRMADAFEQSFEEGAQKVIIIGSDCQDLNSYIVKKAFEFLDKSDVVIGPTFDGGYYLLGMNSFHPELFEGVNWSTETVYKETIEICEKSNLTVQNLPVLSDVDYKEDLTGKLAQFLP